MPIPGIIPDQSVTGSTDLTLPPETISAPIPAKSGVDVDPFSATPEQLASLAAEGEKPTPAEPEPPPQKPEEPGGIDLDNFELDPESEKAFLADMGPDFAKYGSVREALLDLHQARSSLEPQYQREHQVVDRLNQVAKALNVSPDDVLASLAAIDPRQMAAQAPQFSNIEGFITKSIDPEYQPAYRNMAQAFMADLLPAVQGNFARALNGLANELDAFKTDVRIEKFTGKPENAEWIGREQEIRDALDMNPQYRGKPNAMDLATRWIKAGAEPRPVKKQVSEKVRQTLRQIEANRRAGHLESPGRGMPPGKVTPLSDADLEKAGYDKRIHKQTGDLLDEAERRGAIIS